MKFKSANGEIHSDKATGNSGNTYFGMKQRLANGTFTDGDDGITIIMPPPVVQKVRTLDEVKQAAITQINQQKKQLEQAGFYYSEIKFQSDDNSIKRISNAAIAATSALMASQAFEITWSAEDNSEITLDANGLLAFQAAMVTRGQILHVTAKNLKAAVNAIDTADFDSEQKAIEAITGYLDEYSVWQNGVAHWQEYHDIFSTEEV